MKGLRAVTVPPWAHLNDYPDPPHYSDCFAVDVAGHVDLATFVAAFYQTPLFRLEALILRLAVRKPSTHADAVSLARGETDTFAAWTVEARSENALMMCDMAGRTRSWFGVEPMSGSTRLLFGSVVTAVAKSDGDAPQLGAMFTLLLPFHKLYARALLWWAARRVRSASQSTAALT